MGETGGDNLLEESSLDDSSGDDNVAGFFELEPDLSGFLEDADDVDGFEGDCSTDIPGDGTLTGLDFSPRLGDSFEDFEDVSRTDSS